MSRRALKIVAAACVCLVVGALAMVFVARAHKTAPGNRIQAAAAVERGVQSSDAAEKVQDAGAAVEEAIDKKVAPAMSAAGLKIAIAEALARRTAIVHQLAPYSKVEAALKDEIRKENQGITKEKIGGLLGMAADAEERFWTKGDFRNVAAFDDIYRARATVELCLEADPLNEAALKELVEVLEAGWPYYLSDNDAEAKEQGKGNQWALYAPLWTLWDQYASKRSDPSYEDLERGADLLQAGTSPDAYAALAAQFSKDNPSASTGAARAAAKTAAKDRMMKVADWALALCQSKGAAWTVYADQFRKDRECIAATGFADLPFEMHVIPHETIREMADYDTGRFSAFVGPRSRAEKLLPCHEIGRPKRAGK